MRVPGVGCSGHVVCCCVLLIGHAPPVLAPEMLYCSKQGHMHPEICVRPVLVLMEFWVGSCTYPTLTQATKILVQYMWTFCVQYPFLDFSKVRGFPIARPVG